MPAVKGIGGIWMRPRSTACLARGSRCPTASASSIHKLKMSPKMPKTMSATTATLNTMIPQKSTSRSTSYRRL
jgi:hypothetical protein